MGTRDEQREKRREEILRAGLDLFIRKGYTATKIKDIAGQVGMSTGLLFHYFESKEALYDALIAYGISGPMGIMEEMEREPLAFFEFTAKQIIQYIQADPFVAKMFVLMSQVFYSDDVPQKTRARLRDFDIYKPTAEVIKRGQANGTVRTGDPMALGIAFWCAIQGIAEQYALKPAYPCPESEWIVDMIRRKAE